MTLNVLQKTTKADIDKIKKQGRVVWLFIKFKLKHSKISDAGADTLPKRLQHHRFPFAEGDGWTEKVESQRALGVATLPGLSSATNTSSICGPLTVGAMYRTSWAPFKIGAQLPLQVQSLNISHFP